MVLSGVLPKYLFSMKEFKTIAEECVEILAATTLHLVQAVVCLAQSLGLVGARFLVTVVMAIRHVRRGRINVISIKNGRIV